MRNRFSHSRGSRRFWLTRGLAALAAGGLLPPTMAQTILKPASYTGGPLDNQAENQPANSTKGSFEIQDTEYYDAARDRPVPVRIYMPLGKANSGPKPLVMFSHGMGGSRMGYSYLAKHLASAGFVCIHPQHLGSDRAVWSGNPFAVFANLTRAAADSNVIDRVKDISFVLTQVLKGPLAEQIDPRRLAVAGHSYGANTALLASGATVLRGDGLVYNLRDPRFKCAVIISAPPFHGSGDMKPILGDIAMASLHITGTDDVIRVPGYGSGLSARIEVFDAMSIQNEFAQQKSLFVFDGATHSVFTDRIDRVGPIASAKIKKGTSDLVLAFLDTQLRAAPSSELAKYAKMHQELFSDVRLAAK